MLRLPGFQNPGCIEGVRSVTAPEAQLDGRPPVDEHLALVIDGATLDLRHVAQLHELVSFRRGEGKGLEALYAALLVH